MKLAALVIILLSNNGYWIGGRSVTVTIRPAVVGALPALDVVWELKLNGNRLDHGQIPLGGKDDVAAVHLTVPRPRTRVMLHWTYSIVDRRQNKVLETGDLPVNVFPSDLIDDAKERVGANRVVVLDDPDGLPKFLRRAGIPFERISATDRLQFVDAGVVLVGQETSSNSPFAQAPLLGLASSGASVLIFRQSRPQTLIGYSIARRNVAAKLDWRITHPLLADLDAGDWQSLIAGTTTLQVVQLPADEPALEIASFPRETPGDRPVPIDAVLVSKSIGKGRIVLCQIPFGDWNEDPRGQIFLRNALDYLLTRPEPTPRPSERTVPRLAEPVPESRIEISSGDVR